jgi:hypothetical protein
MPCNYLRRLKAVGDAARKIVQNIQSCQAELAKPAEYKINLSNSGRCSELCARSRSTACSTLSVILCATMIPTVFCSCSFSVDVVPPSGIRYCNPAATLLPISPKLKKVISFSGKMKNHANLQGNCREDQDDEIELHLYTPVHSNSQSVTAGTHFHAHVAGGSSPTTRHRPHSGDMAAAAPYVYTRLQTQLFPEMRF